MRQSLVSYLLDYVTQIGLMLLRAVLLAATPTWAEILLVSLVLVCVFGLRVSLAGTLLKTYKASGY